MHFDFAAILVILTAVTGLIWGADSLVFAPRRRASLAGAGGGGDNVATEPKEPVVVEYARSFFPVIVIVLVIRSFLFEPFRIPSDSMMPTLLDGDLILVNKFTYGLRLPVVDTKVLELGAPERGDVVVFRKPQEERFDYIKRVVGLPGDEIVYRDKQLFINGELVNVRLLGTYQPLRPFDDNLPRQEYREALPGRDHEILIHDRRRNDFKQDRWIVPDGHYFVMGDNRDNSQDSRVWGFVPDQNLVGKAVVIWMHLSPDGFNRIGTGID